MDKKEGFYSSGARPLFGRADLTRTDPVSADEFAGIQRGLGVELQYLLIHRSQAYTPQGVPRRYITGGLADGTRLTLAFPEAPESMELYDSAVMLSRANAVPVERHNELLERATVEWNNVFYKLHGRDGEWDWTQPPSDLTPQQKLFVSQFAGLFKDVRGKLKELKATGDAVSSSATVRPVPYLAPDPEIKKKGPHVITQLDYVCTAFEGADVKESPRGAARRVLDTPELNDVLGLLKETELMMLDRFRDGPPADAVTR